MPSIKIYTKFQSEAKTENILTIDVAPQEVVDFLVGAVKEVAEAPAPEPKPYEVVIQAEVDGVAMVDVTKSCAKSEVTDKEKRFIEKLGQFVSMNG